MKGLNAINAIDSNVNLTAKLGAKRGLTSLAFSISLCFMAALPVASSIAADGPDMNKTLRVVFPSPETGFDPAVTRDLYSSTIGQAVFESLYTYDYLARPSKLAPMAAESLPEISADGKTYTIRLKKGVLFADDPAFGGKKRELVMADFVYSFKRLFDPRLASPHRWLFEDKIVGLDEMAEAAKKAGKLDMEAKVEGFEIVDKYTLKIHLKQPDFNLGMILAHGPTAAMAREVVEKYQDAQGQVMAHPVGTGPYRLTKWVRGASMSLEANPNFRGEIWNFAAGSDPEDARLVAEMKGKRMPQIGKIEVMVMVEDQSRWLSFQNNETDIFELQGPLAPKALIGGKLKPEMAAKGVKLSRIIDPEISYYYWNMRDPVVGGNSKEKIALRRALAMSHNVEEEIKIVWNGEAEAVQFPVPPGVVGHDPSYKSMLQYEPAAANALLDKFGYKKGADGWRTMPDGKPLVIKYTARADSLGQQQSEMWKKSLTGIGVKMEGDKRPFPDILKAEKECQLQTRTNPWIADYPDGDNFMMLFYGKNIHQNNNGCVEDKDYDKLYEQSRLMPAGPERNALYRKMARILELNASTRIGYARYRNMLAQPNVLGFKKHPILNQEWMYSDLDNKKK